MRKTIVTVDIDNVLYTVIGEFDLGKVDKKKVLRLPGFINPNIYCSTYNVTGQIKEAIYKRVLTKAVEYEKERLMEESKEE